MSGMPNDVEANWVTGSHDMGRVASRLGEHLVDHMNMLALMLPGLSVTYQGEEMGMRNTNISWEETRDPAGCACGPSRYQECSRDPERTPFQVNLTCSSRLPLTSSTSKSTSHPSKITFRHKITVEQRVQRWLQRQLVDLAPGKPQLCVAQLGQSGWKKFSFVFLSVFV